MSDAEAPTWRQASGLIAFHIVLSSGERPASEMARLASWMIDHVPMIGEVQEVSLSTLSEGEDVVTWRVGNIDKGAVERARPDPAAPLELTLILDTDIYAARSWAATRDNHVRAERNAPAFNRFLHELTISSGAKLTAVDAPDYRDQVGPSGFIISSSRS